MITAIHKFFILTIALMTVFSGIGMGQIKNPGWVLENKQADWEGRDSHGEFVFGGNIWIMGGWFTPQRPNPRDVWKSADGKTWTKVLETAPWTTSDLPVSLVFKDKMWMMGGRKLPGTVCSNEVWSSTDGARWNLETPNAGWSPRLGSSFVVFKGKMWVMGGTNDFYHNNDTTMFNDVWSSADGKDWQLELANAPWSKRAHSRAMVFDNKIWVMGGGSRQPDIIPTNDIWNSEDGVNWTLVTSKAAWKPRMWFSSDVYRDRMWVLGGWENGGNIGDVWYSKDGKSWTEFKSDLIWSKRHEHTALVFKDKIWVAAGAAEPDYKVDSEVWSLNIPPSWFEVSK